MARSCAVVSAVFAVAGSGAPEFLRSDYCCFCAGGGRNVWLGVTTGANAATSAPKGNRHGHNRNWLCREWLAGRGAATDKNNAVRYRLQPLAQGERTCLY